ncbi:MAG TPA: hypothetical protein VFL04_06625, partial [Rectinemataceae bacterium]|nr:hypothetical protein [Rectinemataceae bacterium]
LGPDSSLREALGKAMSDSASARTALRGSASEFAYLFQASTLLLNRRVERAWHSFEEEAAIQRASLGEYYDALGLDAKAARQYRRALAVDPSNVQVMYSLARAEERGGNWPYAISLLGRVAAADPSHPEAASRHNALARAHAARMDGEASFSSDTNSLAYRATSLLSLPVGARLSLEPSLQVSSVRDWNQGVPAYLSAEFGLALPFSISSGALELRPRASFYGTSSNYAAQGSSTLSPQDFAASLRLMTGAGASLSWRSRLVSARGDYAWAPLPDTVDPIFTPLYAHRLELSASAYLPMTGFMRYLAPRAYGLGYYIPADGNLLGTGLLELVPAARLSDSPWASLGLPVCVQLEDSSRPLSSPYYAADAALTAKTGLRLQTVFGLRRGDRVSIMVQALGGLYETGAFSAAPDRSGYAQLVARLELGIGDASYFVSIEATQTAKGLMSRPGYWSLSVLGGLSAKQSRLVAP